MGHLVARYVRSLTPLTLLTGPAALCFAMLTLLARSIHGLAHSLCSLPRGTVEILEYVFTLWSRFTISWSVGLSINPLVSQLAHLNHFIHSSWIHSKLHQFFTFGCQTEVAQGLLGSDLTNCFVVNFSTTEYFSELIIVSRFYLVRTFSELITMMSENSLSKDTQNEIIVVRVLGK